MNLYHYFKSLTEAEEQEVADDFTDARDNDIILRNVNLNASTVPGGEETKKIENASLGTMKLNELEKRIKNRVDANEYEGWTISTFFKMRDKAYSIEFTFKKGRSISLNDMQKESKDHPILMSADFKKIKVFDDILNVLRDEWNGKWENEQ
jgi:hypothetical protein